MSEAKRREAQAEADKQARLKAMSKPREHNVPDFTKAKGQITDDAKRRHMAQMKDIAVVDERGEKVAAGHESMTQMRAQHADKDKEIYMKIYSKTGSNKIY